MAGLMGALDAIKAAEERAAELRAQHGAGAEAQVETELSGLEPRDPRRPYVLDVLRALRAKR